MKIIGELKDEAGIYKISCLSDGKYYYGSSENLKRRYGMHFSQLKNKKHHSRHLQNAWNKYGEENFNFEVVEYCEDKKEILISREQYYLDTFKSYDPDFGFNICIKADSPKGIKKTKEQNEKASRARNESHGIEYELVAPNGDVYKGKGLNKLAKEYGLNSAAMHGVATGRLNYHKGWQRNGFEIESYKFLNPHGELIIIPPKKLALFCRENNLSFEGMVSIWNKHNRTSKGWSRHENKDYYVTLVHESRERVVVNKHFLEYFCEKYSVNSSYLSSLISGGRKFSEGWALEENEKFVDGDYKFYDKNNDLITLKKIQLKEWAIKNGYKYKSVRRLATGYRQNHRDLKAFYSSQEAFSESKKSLIAA